MTSETTTTPPDTLETPGGRRPATEYKDAMRSMRRSGMSYQEIGRRLGFSHEWVRRTIGPDEGRDGQTNIRTLKRARMMSEMTAWLEENGPVTRDQVLSEWGISSGQLTSMVRDGVPGYLIIMRPRDEIVSTSQDEIDDSLRRAWAALQAVYPDAKGLSHVSYEQVRDSERDLSAPLIIAKTGWIAACKRAGVPDGGAVRGRDTYSTKWTDDDILAWVRTYVQEKIDAHERPTYTGYERYQRTTEGAPSGSMVRNRMRDAGVGALWPEIVAAALAASGD